LLEQKKALHKILLIGITRDLPVQKLSWLKAKQGKTLRLLIEQQMNHKLLKNLSGEFQSSMASRKGDLAFLDM
jgi:hypothetical protein